MPDTNNTHTKNPTNPSNHQQKDWHECTAPPVATFLYVIKIARREVKRYPPSHSVGTRIRLFLRRRTRKTPPK